ncbi:MAG: FecR family protein [Candidatus Omnitrophota bacterium]
MKRLTSLVSIVLSVLLIVPPAALADIIGTITYVEGRVDRLDPASGKYFPVVAGETISENDTLRTKSYSKAEISLNDKSVVRMAPSTRIQVPEYKIDENGLRKKGVINLDRGRIRTIVSKTKDATSFEINTPNATGTVKGSDIFVSYQKSATGVLVVDGVLNTVNPAFPDEVFDIKKGTASVVPHNAPPKEPRMYLNSEVERYESETGPQIRAMEGLTGAEEATQVRVALIAGTVQVFPAGSDKPHAPIKNETLNVGDKIVTGVDGHIEIYTDNGHIVSLHSNTQLILNMLTRDPETATYKNLLEVTKGQIVAKLNTIKGKSSFEVKTPTAVCGVRGTIMYLDVLTKLTTAFFEGGAGYITSIVSGITEDVGAGQTSSCNDTGYIPPPRNTTSADRKKFGATRGSEGSGSYGYSPPGSGDGPGDPGTPGGGNTPPDPNTGGGSLPPDFIPPNHPLLGGNGGDGNTAPVTTSIKANLNGSFGSAQDGDGTLGGGSTPPNSIVGALSFETTIAPWSGIHPAILAGTYEKPEGLSLWGAEITGGGDDGGKIYGFAGGSWHSWDGALSMLYIDSLGLAGILLGTMSGLSNDDNGVFAGTGGIFTIPVDILEIPPANLMNSLNHENGTFDIASTFSNGNGYFYGEMDTYTVSINEEPWGIWASLATGMYDRPDDLSIWSGTVGGTLGDDGFFLGTLEGTDDLEGALRLDITSAYIDYYTLGVFFGTIFGLYEPANSYSFEGVGAGGWIGSPLTLSGVWGAGKGGIEACLYYNDDGEIVRGGSESGLVGSDVSPWNGPAPFLAMGEYYIDERFDDTGPVPFIWNNELRSYNVMADNNTTLDGGAFFCYTGGLWNNGFLNGKAYGLYVDPFGTAGLLLSNDMNGEYFSLSLDYDYDGLWYAYGMFETLPMLSNAGDLGITPENFEDYIGFGDLTADVEGGFGGFDTDNESFIEGQAAWGEIAFLNYDEGNSAQYWGIYDIKLEGPDTYYNPGNLSTWFAFLEGEIIVGNGEGRNNYWEGGMGGIWIDGEIIGILRGIYITDDNIAGIIAGDVYGLYDPTGDGYGTWIGESVGTYTAMGIAESFDTFNEPLLGCGIGAFDSGTGFDITDFHGEIFGLEDQSWGIWGADFSGTTDGPGTPAWQATISSIVGDDNSGVILGTVSGSDWSEMRILGSFKGFFWHSSDEGENLLTMGAIDGDVFGTFEVEGEPTAFNAIGVGEWVELADLETDLLSFDMEGLNALIDLPVTEVFSDILSGAGGFTAGGAIAGTMDISFFADIHSILEGIWGALITGTYSGVTEGPWTLELTSDDTTAILTGTEWSDNEWLAIVNGAGPNGMTFTGGAGGTYSDADPTGSGTFEGAGAGTFETTTND